MSTTRPCSPGDRGPEPDADGASGLPGVSGGPDGSEAPGASGVSDVPSGEALGDPVGDPVAAARPVGRQARRLSFADASGIVPLARDFARQALYAWGWLPASGADRRAAAEDVLLVVSELVTNACLHADGPEEMWIACEGKVLRVEVSDRGTGVPAPRTPHQAGRPGGHGMFIVQRLCLDWGVTRTEGVAGKTVWAELGAVGG
ncbi:ATP-binding protein [Streptomyces sp. NPDC091292]|uniref:ATP-binding protein n=1 Tax=Streptomyces sp. NPDC091292 TaxID=3365991 RepID=UPI0038221AF0